MNWKLPLLGRRTTRPETGPLDNLRNDDSFARLAERIKDVGSGKRIFFVPNIGNWGDALINAGTTQFLDAAGIEYTEINRPKVTQLRKALEGTGMRLDNTLLIAGGGGAFCETWPSTRNFLDANAALFDHTVLLPTTFELPPLDIDPDRISYFGRDRYTSLENNPDSMFCHDMAFYLQLQRSPAEPVIEQGHFFRDDKERHPEAVMPGDNLDLSAQGHHMQPAPPFFQILAPYRKILTDRMHVAIAGSLLGREVVLYPGSYFKSIDVFRSSLEPHYPSTSLGSW
ncbi:hypothetical protein [Arthrobacter pigmenti]